MSEFEGRCGSCAAFTRARIDVARGKIGECALEVFPPPVSATSTCSRYRPKGAAAPGPRPRAAGEPRRGGSPRQPSERSASLPAIPNSVPLPQEIDIDMDIEEFRRVLRDVLAEELGVSNVPMASRFVGGELVITPGKAGTQEKRVPLDAFFHKIVLIRDKLRVLEQKINAHEQLSDTDKVQLQQYITGCYGSLTTFNILFAEREDGFAGSAKE
ncbi:MAG: hypothetical protein IPK82_13760 [Polyangiaceae bacterium]|nr:hypothetical protein [Polyangiaceae bacterium]